MKFYPTSLKATVCAAAIAVAAPSIAQEMPPQDAKPGTCWAQVAVPAVYQTAPVEVVVKPATVELKEFPAVYKDVQKQVLVEEESFELEVIPAVYDEVEETVVIEPEQLVKTIVPPVFETKTERVQVAPARTEWKKGTGPYQRIDAATGEIMCLVEIPAQYEEIEKTVMVTPASVREEVIPAKTTVVKKRVMVKPPETRKKVIPARYETVTVRELAEPASVREVNIPAETRSIEKQQLVSTGKTEWREILCETNMTADIIIELQRRLVAAGYGLGGAEPNGNYGPATQAAVRSFQEDNGLPTGGLTIAILERLGMRDAS